MVKREAEEFCTLLKYERDRRLVGVKFLFSKEDYDRLEIKEATHQMFFCMMVKAGAKGHRMKVKKEHIYCSSAAEVLGFAKPSSETKSGEAFLKENLYGSREVAESIARNTPFLTHSAYGMWIQPLELCEKEPDIVMSFCQPYTAMRIMQAYSYEYGFAEKLRFAGMGGVCTELMARSYQNQDINVSFLCSGTRFAGAWRDDEVGISFPYPVFRKVLDGLWKTMNTYEPDDEKAEILQRARSNGVTVDIEFGKNYHDSSLGVARMGVKGYRSKKCMIRKEEL